MSRSGWDKYLDESHLSKTEKRYSWNDLEDVAESATWFDEQKKLEEVNHKLENIDALVAANVRVAIEETKKQIRDKDIQTVKED